MGQNISDEYRERDKNRPVIVHCLGLLIQKRTACQDLEAMQAAWDIYDYLGQPDIINMNADDLRRARSVMRRR